MRPTGWTFITNHGLVLGYIYHNPDHTAREISNHVGITERTTHKIISDLEEGDTSSGTRAAGATSTASTRNFPCVTTRRRT